MTNYNPKLSKNDYPYSNELGSIPSDFQQFEPNPKYNWNTRVNPQVPSWKIIVPRLAPPVGRLPEVIEKMINATWKYTEPSSGVQRGNHIIGTRNGVVPNFTSNLPFNPQVTPIRIGGDTLPNKTAIASDWKLFEQIPRTNAVTFRGDTRPPGEVIVNCNGFSPPNSRKDRVYLETNIFEAFESYLGRRYQRKLTKVDFLRAVDTALPSAADKKLLVDYMMWRKITEKESMHLGRMVVSE